MKGFNVLHPIAWDAFGLPAEQYALQTGTHPAVTTKKNIDRFREQLQSLGENFLPPPPPPAPHSNTKMSFAVYGTAAGTL